MWMRTRSLTDPRYRHKIVYLDSKATMFLLLLTLTLGVASAENLFYEAQQREQQPRSDGLLCPDQNSRCPNTATCCQLSSGKWGCCPFARATCCDDNVHCCPSGYSCNNAKEHCVRAINNDTIPWASKEPNAVSVDSSSEEAINPRRGHVCPDRVSSCGVGASCCRAHTGAYRCCPYPNNVCCSNGHHCCPRCTVCDWLGFRCIPGFETEKWETVGEATPVSLASEMTEATEKVHEIGEDKMLNPYAVVWCDSKYYCRNGQTCCRRSWRKWGCCPHKCGNCCKGGFSCCPPGTRCRGRYCYWN